MAVYKVPQDVEADDKLLGPLSFRQFIYASIASVAAFVAYLLAKIFLGLIIIPLPFIILFTILALPLRKDQPMEMYLVAIIRFFLKPRLRKWEPEGAVKLVEIVAPRNMEEQRTNNLNPDEARNRLGYLAELMDTRGWSARGVLDPALQPAVVVSDSDISNDIMDKDANVARSFDSLLAQQSAKQQQTTQQKVQQWRENAADNSDKDTLDQAAPRYDPYPSSIRQHVIKPLETTPDKPAESHVKTTSDNAVTSPVSPDIMRLATDSKNLSISTIANEAHRLQNKQDDNEVVITLR